MRRKTLPALHIDDADNPFMGVTASAGLGRDASTVLLLERTYGGDDACDDEVQHLPRPRTRSESPTQARRQSHGRRETLVRQRQDSDKHRGFVGDKRRESVGTLLTYCDSESAPTRPQPQSCRASIATDASSSPKKRMLASRISMALSDSSSVSFADADGRSHGKDGNGESPSLARWRRAQRQVESAGRLYCELMHDVRNGVAAEIDRGMPTNVQIVMAKVGMQCDGRLALWRRAYRATKPLRLLLLQSHTALVVVIVVAGDANDDTGTSCSRQAT